jgi:hypothetical protein
MAKHRQETMHWLDKIRIYVFFLKNRWYFFVKPDLKKKIKQIKDKIYDKAIGR